VRPIYRTGVQLPSRCCILYISFSTSISTEYFKHAAHSPFFTSKSRLFHNATFFASCFIHIFKYRLCLNLNVKLKVCKSVHHRTIQINHNLMQQFFQFIILTFVYSSTSFGRFSAHHQKLNDCSGSLWFYLRIVVIILLCSWSGWPARPRTQHDCHHDTKIKLEAATAVIELLMMGGKTPETC
jgi:hypothetical protein